MAHIELPKTYFTGSTGAISKAKTANTPELYRTGRRQLTPAERGSEDAFQRSEQPAIEAQALTLNPEFTPQDSPAQKFEQCGSIAQVCGFLAGRNLPDIRTAAKNLHQETQAVV